MDGGIHLSEDVRERDLEREKIILDLGWTILRFTNDEIEGNIYSALKKLEIYIKEKSSLSNMERESKGEV